MGTVQMSRCEDQEAAIPIEGDERLIPIVDQWRKDSLSVGITYGVLCV